MATETVSLLDYSNGRADQGVVLFWAGFGMPTGDYEALCHPDMHFAERRDLLNLTGTVGVDGEWRWDGTGNPTDDRGNSITQLNAYVDQVRWDQIDREYSEGA
jgi:hypothetical protein